MPILLAARFTSRVKQKSSTIKGNEQT